MKKSEYGLPTYPKNRYLYNGKEINSDRMNSGSLNWYDYGARFYDPQIGRFASLDPLSDKFIHLSPCNYASNNPVTNIDLWGLQGVNINFLTELSLFASKFSQGFQKSFGATGRLLTEQKVSNLIPQEVKSEMGQITKNTIDKAGILTDINNLFSGLNEMGSSTSKFVKEGAKDLLSKGQVVGEAIQLGGILTANPVVAGIGGKISNASTGAILLINASNGENNIGEMLYEFGKTTISGSVGKYFDKAEKAGDLAKPANDIFRGINYLWRKAADITKEQIEKEKQK